MATLDSATTSESPDQVASPRAKTLRGTDHVDLFTIAARGSSEREATLRGSMGAVAGSRELSRALARRIPDTVVKALMEEHGILAEKLVDHSLSAREKARLTYVRWQLDRIEDARIGEDLDALEELAALHEAISDEVARFVGQVEHVSQAPRRRR